MAITNGANAPTVFEVDQALKKTDYGRESRKYEFKLPQSGYDALRLPGIVLLLIGPVDDREWDTERIFSQLEHLITGHMDDRDLYEGVMQSDGHPHMYQFVLAARKAADLDALLTLHDKQHEHSGHIEKGSPL